MRRIDPERSHIGSEVSVGARRGYPARTIRLVLGEESHWRGGEYVEGPSTTHIMTAATARALARALTAEARIVEGKK